MSTRKIIINLVSINLALLVAGCNGGSNSSTASQSVLTAYPPQFATTKQQGVFSSSGNPQFDSLNKYEVVANSGNESEGYYLEIDGFESAGEAEPSSMNSGRLRLFEKDCVNVDFKEAQFKLSNCRGQLESSGYILTADYFLSVPQRSGTRVAKGKFNLNVPRSDFINEKVTKSDVAKNISGGGRNLQVAPAKVENWLGQGTYDTTKTKPWRYQIRVGHSVEMTHHFFICMTQLEAANLLGRWIWFKFEDKVLFSATQEPKTLDSIAGMRKTFRAYNTQDDNNAGHYFSQIFFGDNLDNEETRNIFLDSSLFSYFTDSEQGGGSLIAHLAVISRLPCNQ